VLHSPRLGAGLIRRLPWPAGFLLILWRVRRGFASGKAKLKNQCHPLRPRFAKYYTLKTKIFLGNKLGRYAAINKRKAFGASCPASCVQGFKAKAWGGRGAGTPAPQLRLSPAKFGAGKFCRFAQRKNKKSKGRI